MPVRKSARASASPPVDFSICRNGLGDVVFVFRCSLNSKGGTTMKFGFWQRALIAAGIVALTGSALGQQPPAPVRVRGAIETVDGNTLTVKARDGSSLTIVMADNVRVMAFVPADATIVAYAPGEKSELKPGAQIIIFGAQKQPDGTLQTQAVNVGRGLAPPM